MTWGGHQAHDHSGPTAQVGEVVSHFLQQDVGGGWVPMCEGGVPIRNPLPKGAASAKRITVTSCKFCF
jgi:hypothetical protein